MFTDTFTNLIVSSI